MRKKLIIVPFVLMFALAGCGDKIQTAKTVLAFVNLGITTVDGTLNTYASAKKAECLKAGPEGSAPFIACYKSTKDMMDKWAIIEPKLEKASENAATYIKAAESGQTADYGKAVKETVCLLTETYNIIPDKGWESLKKKIKMYVDLAGAYACAGNAISSVSAPTSHQLFLLKTAHRLMSEITGKRG